MNLKYFLEYLLFQRNKRLFGIKKHGTLKKKSYILSAWFWRYFPYLVQIERESISILKYIKNK